MSETSKHLDVFFTTEVIIKDKYTKAFSWIKISFIDSR